MHFEVLLSICIYFACIPSVQAGKELLYEQECDGDIWKLKARSVEGDALGHCTLRRGRGEVDCFTSGVKGVTHSITSFTDAGTARTYHGSINVHGNETVVSAITFWLDLEGRALWVDFLNNSAITDLALFDPVDNAKAFALNYFSADDFICSPLHECLAIRQSSDGALIAYLFIEPDWRDASAIAFDANDEVGQVLTDARVLAALITIKGWFFEHTKGVCKPDSIEEVIIRLSPMLVIMGTVLLVFGCFLVYSSYSESVRKEEGWGHDLKTGRVFKQCLSSVIHFFRLPRTLLNFAWVFLVINFFLLFATELFKNHDKKFKVAIFYISLLQVMVTWIHLFMIAGWPTEPEEPMADAESTNKNARYLAYAGIAVFLASGTQMLVAAAFPTGHVSSFWVTIVLLISLIVFTAWLYYFAKREHELRDVLLRDVTDEEEEE